MEWFDRYDRTRFNRDEVDQSANPAWMLFDRDNHSTESWPVTDHPAKAKRLTWTRFVLALMVLIPLAVVGWWNWPRGDSRFVGKWTFDSPNGSPIFEMRANGTATYYVSDYPVTWYWATWDGNFSFGWPSAYPMGADRARDFSNWSYERLKFTLNTDYEQYRIISVTPELIEMQRWIGEKEITRLYRVHED